MTTSEKQNNKSSSREDLLKDWLASISDKTLGNIQSASADASFRRYFRVTDKNDGKTYIVMDAPPDKENCTPFIQVTQLLRNASVNAPEIIRENEEQGFLLLSDLGNKTYLDHLTNEQADTLYSDAIDSLVLMQKIESDLPQYNEQRLRDEMNLFEPWYLNKHLDVHLNKTQKNSLDSVCNMLAKSAIEQPQAFVHRDYHSRNLMLLNENNPGIIDYQDAVIGPISYDLVSLLKDCYIEWPRNKIEKWIDVYLLKSGKNNNEKYNREEFIRWFDLMGVQRHLKVLGIFSRLNYRDGKQQYLNDLPLTLKYIIDACQQYNELEPLHELLEELVLNHPMVAKTIPSK